MDGVGPLGDIPHTCTICEASEGSLTGRGSFVKPFIWQHFQGVCIMRPIGLQGGATLEELGSSRLGPCGLCYIGPVFP